MNINELLQLASLIQIVTASDQFLCTCEQLNFSFIIEIAMLDGGNYMEKLGKLEISKISKSVIS